jgi:hypothetical protein
MSDSNSREISKGATDCPFGPKEELQTLLVEYSAMRSEAVQRISTAYQLTAVVVAGAALVLTRRDSGMQFILTAGAITIFLFWIWLLMIRDARRATRRIRWVESQVNRLLGKSILTHESTLNDLWHRLGIL